MYIGTKSTPKRQHQRTHKHHDICPLVKASIWPRLALLMPRKLQGKSYVGFTYGLYWQWVKKKSPGDHRFWSISPFTTIYRFFRYPDGSSKLPRTTGLFLFALFLPESLKKQELIGIMQLQWSVARKMSIPGGYLSCAPLRQVAGFSVFSLAFRFVSVKRVVFLIAHSAIYRLVSWGGDSFVPSILRTSNPRRPGTVVVLCPAKSGQRAGPRGVRADHAIATGA